MRREAIALVSNWSVREKGDLVTYEGRKMLPASRLATPSTVFEQERDLDNSAGPSCHQGIAEDRMHHRAQRKILRMSTHGPASQQDDHAW